MSELHHLALHGLVRKGVKTSKMYIHSNVYVVYGVCIVCICKRCICCVYVVCVIHTFVFMNLCCTIINKVIVFKNQNLKI